MRKSNSLPKASETGGRVNAVREWRSYLTGFTGAASLFLSLSGLIIFAWPFSEFSQINVAVHTVVGLLVTPAVICYLLRHWWVRRKGRLSHFQLLGYIALMLMAVCFLSGFVVTWQGVVGPRIDYAWDLVHLMSGTALVLFLVVHLVTVVISKVANVETRQSLFIARRSFFRRSIVGTVILILLCMGWVFRHDEPKRNHAFPDNYSWTFGEDRPFAPSLARIDHSIWTDRVRDRILDVIGEQNRTAFLTSYEQVRREPIGLFEHIKQCLSNLQLDNDQRQLVASTLLEASSSMKQTGAINAQSLAGSAGCGSSGCHSEIYQEWLPSAHRYSSMDDMFQKVQSLMAVEVSPESTRYCAGCHDPISLFSGAKNSDNITLSAEGSDEGTSCLVCHSIVQTDVQGNGDYTIQPQKRYVYEQHDGAIAKFISDFLIRTYPHQHIRSYSRALYKTPEFCAACHKQYLDKEVNTDIGKVQGQNQYDSWKNSRWFHEGDPEKSISCRECHMPLVNSHDPAKGDQTDYNRSLDDGMHRSHRTLASNQYVPRLHHLDGADQHIELTQEWLRGNIEIPEIADKWTTGPVIRLSVVAPETAKPGDTVPIQVILTNNKVGHDFPTGPLDMLESWIELKVTDETGRVLHHSGSLNDTGEIQETLIWYKADGFDRDGKLIDRHNLWDLVGASYKRALYPGAADTISTRFQCPSISGAQIRDQKKAPLGQRLEMHDIPISVDSVGEISVEAILWYRKANPEFLNRVYGIEKSVQSPATDMSHAITKISVVSDG